MPVDRRMPRELLRESLDEIFADPIDPRHALDAVESKLFGIGSESYVVGSHEFYLGYAIARQKLLCLDAGHFHPTEGIADKFSAVLQWLPAMNLYCSIQAEDSPAQGFDMKPGPIPSVAVIVGLIAILVSSFADQDVLQPMTFAAAPVGLSSASSSGTPADQQLDSLERAVEWINSPSLTARPAWRAATSAATSPPSASTRTSSMPPGRRSPTPSHTT